MSVLAQDLFYAARLLKKQPGVTAIMVISLALGIGANTLIFSFINAAFLRPLPYSDPDGLVMVWFTPPNKPALNEPLGRSGASRQNCFALKERSRTLDITCLQSFSVSIGQDEPGSAETERVLGHQFSGDFPRLLGVTPLLGRWFTPDEERFDADPVIVLSYDQWQKRFNGSPDSIGKRLRVDGALTTVIGVMPQGFQFIIPKIDYWAPFLNPPNVAASPVRFLQLPARLRSGVSLEQARSEMNALALSLAEDFPATNRDWGIRLEPLKETLNAGAAEQLIPFQGAVAFVLLIACANVAGLLLARGAAQQKELALRAALGSTRFRIVRQLLTESVLLAILGGLFGVAVGWAGLHVMLTMLPSNGVGITMDMRVLAFTLLLSVITGLAFGILPALQVSRAEVMDALRENSRSATGARARQRMRSAFVIVQIALALVLLTGAGLMLKSFRRLSTVNFGFDSQNLTTFQIQFPRGAFSRISNETTPTGALTVDLSPRLNVVAEEIRERLAQIAGVQSATATVTPPLIGFFGEYTFTIDDRAPAASEREALRAEWNAVWPEYFDTLGVPLIRGRTFNARDTVTGSPVVIISSTMARNYWPHDDPIGKRIHIGFFKDSPREVVGIVGDVQQAVRQQVQRPQMYVPYAQLPLNQQGQGYRVVNFVVRSNTSAAEVIPAMRSVVAEVDRALAMYDIRTVEDYASNQTLGDRIYLTLLGVFGGVAVLLAIVGVYGIMAHSVNQRTNEIGVRLALGAGSWNVLALVLRHGLILVLIGLILGMGASFALTRVIQHFLWQVTATDPQTFAFALLALASIAFVACYIPARRALDVDPVVALRTE